MNTELIILLAVFIFGSFIGSFLNVVIWRLPKDQKLNGRSMCPNCHHQLIWLDLVPVFSFLAFGAKCRYCKKKISWRYPLIELITGALFVFAVLLASPTQLIDWLVVVKYSFVFSVLLVIFVIDLEHYLILDKIILPTTIVVLIFNLVFSVLPLGQNLGLTSALLNSLIGMLAGFLPFYLLWKISKGRWMGLGDAKLGLFLGAVFGFPQIWVCYFLAFFIGSLVGIPLIATGKKQLSSKLPFGTFLAVSAYLTLWLGPDIIHWYFGLIGLA